jgi:hypothetical protein
MSEIGTYESGGVFKPKEELKPVLMCCCPHHIQWPKHACSCSFEKSELRDRIERLEAENLRFRKALEEIFKYTGVIVWLGPSTNQGSQKYVDIAKLAEEALKGEK